MSKRKQIIALLGFYAACFIVQLTGSWLTMESVKSWYPTLEKAELTPPGYWFGIVWTTLYAMMAVAAWRVWRKEGSVDTYAQRVWLSQLVTGLIWSGVFFGMRMPQEGLAIIACLWLLIVFTLKRFWPIDRVAALLLVPLLLWVSFASYLNYMIVHLN